MSHELAHGHKPYGTAAGIFLGLLIWWSGAAVVIWLVLKLFIQGEPPE